MPAASLRKALRRLRHTLNGSSSSVSNGIDLRYKYVYNRPSFRESALEGVRWAMGATGTGRVEGGNSSGGQRYSYHEPPPSSTSPPTSLDGSSGGSSWGASGSNSGGGSSGLPKYVFFNSAIHWQASHHSHGPYAPYIADIESSMLALNALDPDNRWVGGWVGGGGSGE